MIVIFNFFKIKKLYFHYNIDGVGLQYGSMVNQN